jgi:phage terminase small subunit
MAPEMTRDEIIATLVRDNPRGDLGRITIYADALVEYRAAQACIEAQGTVVAHPRTAAPIDNPYLKIRDKASKVLRGMFGLTTDAVWPQPAAETATP